MVLKRRTGEMIIVVVIVVVVVTFMHELFYRKGHMPSGSVFLLYLF